MREHKIECYPDMGEDGPNGPCVLVLHFKIPNNKRFKKMTDKEKKDCIFNIDRFQASLQRFKKSIK